MKTTKRLLSFVLVLVMLFGMFPVQANAATIEAEHDHSETTADVQPQAADAVKVEHNGTTTYYADLQEAFNGFAPSNNTYGGKYVVTLLADINGKLSKNLQYPTEELDITLDLNGHTITGDGTSRVVNINLGSNNTGITTATFTLKDSSGDNSGKITGGKGGMYVYGTNLAFNFESGTVTENHGAEKGGGILVGDKVYFKMTGGVVTGNSVSGNSSANTGLGGGICGINMTITGGEINNNVAYGGTGKYTGRGGGVCTEIGGTRGYHSVVIGPDAQIKDNTAENAGDDLFIAKNSAQSAYLYVSIPTENWFIDGMDGQDNTSALCARYNELDPVPYTDGGWEIGTKKAIGLKYFADPYTGPIFTITYTDGVPDEEVFADQTHKGREDKVTPAFKGTPSRIGYKFEGWSPEVPEYPSSDMTFVAQWTPLAAYIVTYTDGVADEEVFPDQVEISYEGYETPAFKGTPTRKGYIFTGWTPEPADTVTATVVYVATWREAAVYTITYTDGVADEEIFPDRVFEIEEQQPTPKYTFDGKREDYKFSKWNPTVADTVTGDATYTAVWATCTHSWGTGVFDEETLSTTYTCSTCGKVKVEYVAAEIDGTYYATLQAALTAVQTKSGNVTIKMLSDVTGAFTFKWTPVISALNLTIDLNGHTITGTGAASVLTLSKSKSSTVVLNLIIEDSSEGKTGTITGGKGASGGAIAFSSNIKGTDSLTINGGNFKNNTATSNGGVASCSISGFDIVINGGVFENNTATGNGGAFYAPNVTINGGTFTNNSSNNATNGGGVVYATTSLTVNDGTFTGNTSAGYGGALYSTSSLIIAGGTFTGNTAKYGGGVAVKGTTPKLTFTAGKIYGNTATAYGDDIVFAGTGTATPTLNLQAADAMGVDGISNWYVDGFCGPTSAGQTDRFSETVKIYAKPSVLTKCTIALKAASHFTVTYTDGVEGEEIFADQVILAGAGAATPAFDGTPVREGFSFAGWTPEVAETVTGDATYAATWKEDAKGAFNGVTFRGDNEGLAVELENLLAYDSVQVKVYFGETLLTTVSWRDEYIQKGIACKFLTASVRTGAEESTQWAATAWTPYVNQMPTKLELFVDGVKMDELALELDAQKWAAQTGVRVPVMGEIVRAWLNPNNGRLMVDLENVGFEQSVVLELYSGETLLTSSSLNTAEYASAIYAELTGNIGVQDYTASDTWPCQAWTAWDNVVPTAVKLVIDGQTVAVCEDIIYKNNGTSMTAADWASFPGTRVPVMGQIVCAWLNPANGRLMVDLENVGFEQSVVLELYSGETLLTSSSLNTAEYGAKIYAELTGNIGVQDYTASDTWPCQAWTAWDNVVPTAVKLVIDGQTVAVCENIIYQNNGTSMTAADWAAFPGTCAVKLESTGAGYETLQAAIDAAMAIMVDAEHENQTITLMSDIHESVEISWVVATSTKHNFYMTIDLNGHTVTGNGGPVFTVGRYSSAASGYKMCVTFNDSVGTAVVTGGNATNGGAIYVSSKNPCDIVINGGKWTGNTATGAGGVLYAAYVGTNNITVNGGIFEGNTAGTNGGAFTARYLYINGGTITGNTANSGGGVYVFISGATKLELNGGAVYGNTATADGDDIIWRANSGTSSTAYMKLIGADTMGVGMTGWYRDDSGARFSEDSAVLFENFAKYTTTKTRVALKAAYVAPKFTVTYTDGVDGEEIFADQTHTVKVGTATPAFEGTAVRVGYTFLGWAPEVAETVTADVIYVAQWERKQPELPKNDGSNVTDALITIICDSDEGHTSKTYGWADPAANIVFPKGSVPVWDEKLNAWTIGVRIDSIGAYYVGLQFNAEHNGIQHTITGGVEEFNRIDTTLVWDEAAQKWQTLTGEAFQVHVACQTVPEVPSMGFHLGKFQIKMTGNVNGTDKTWFETLHADTVTVGEVYGNRAEGFFVDVTVTLDDSYLAAWVAKHGIKGMDYGYAEGTAATAAFTLKYTGDTTGELYDGPEYWAVSGEKSYAVSVVVVAPAAPKQENVTDQLVSIICDSDGKRHETVYGKWYPQHCNTTSDIVWNEELGAWTVDVRVGGLYIMYVSQLEDANYGTEHTLAEDITTVYSTLKWDAEQQLWIPVEAIELHTTCRTAPTAPAYRLQLEGYQIKVKGDMDGDGIWGEATATNNRVKEQHTTTIPENGYTIGEVYGSREEGFFVDITVTLADGDIYLTNWTAQCDPCCTYAYDWTRTEKTVTFTLKYNGSLNGTLHGDRHASNTNYDWVLLSNGNHFGVVAEAYAVEDPNGPTYHKMTSVVTEPTCTEAGYTTHTCSVCGDVVVDTKVDPLGHDWSQWTVVKEPTLTAKGEKTRHCQRKDCDCVETESIPVLEPLATPAITKLENTAEGIKITWGAVEGAERYRIYIKSGNAWKVLANTTETGYVYTGVESGKTYTFTIRCVNDENTIFTSNYNTAGWKKTYIGQPAITGLSSTAKGVQITWDAVPGAAGYRVYVKSGNGWKVLTNTTGTEFLWTGAETNKTYTFTVRCVDADNKVSTSSYNTTGWSHKFYPAPVISKFENTAEGIKITWGAIKGAERYRVYIKSGNAWKVLESTTGTSYVYTGAESGKTYTFTIRCVDADNIYAVSSYNSTGWSQKYVAQPAISKMESTVEGIRITWNAVPGAERYRVYVRSGNTWKVLANTTGTEYLWTGAEAGKTYTFTIRCVDADNKVSTSSYNTTGWSHKYYPTPAITKLESKENGIQITWDAINGAERYRVYVKSGKSWKVIGTPTENGFLWTGAEEGKTYTFTVRSVNADNTVCTSNYNTTGWSIKHQ